MRKFYLLPLILINEEIDLDYENLEYADGLMNSKRFGERD